MALAFIVLLIVVGETAPWKQPTRPTGGAPVTEPIIPGAPSIPTGGGGGGGGGTPPAVTQDTSVIMKAQVKLSDGSVVDYAPGQGGILSILDFFRGLASWLSPSGAVVEAFRFVATSTVTGASLQPGSVLRHNFLAVTDTFLANATASTLLNQRIFRFNRTDYGADNVVASSSWTSGAVASDGTISHQSEWIWSTDDAGSPAGGVRPGGSVDLANQHWFYPGFSYSGLGTVYNSIRFVMTRLEYSVVAIGSGGQLLPPVTVVITNPVTVTFNYQADGQVTVIVTPPSGDTSSPATLTIQAVNNSVPVSASGTVGSTPFSSTPVNITVSPGTYTVTATYGGTTLTQSVTLGSGESRAISFDFTQAPLPTGRLQVSGNRVVDSAGSTFQIRAIEDDTMANQYVPKGYMTNAWVDEWSTRVKALGLNTIGLGLWYGYYMNTFVGTDAYGVTFNRNVTRSELDRVVTRITGNGLYVYIRPFWSGVTYQDVQAIYQKTAPLFDSQYADGEVEYMAFVSDLVTRFKSNLRFIGLTTMNEPPEAGWTGWEFLTEARYHEVWKNAVNAIHQADPYAIAIVPAWHYFDADFPYKDASGNPLPNTMYYFHRYYRYDVVDNPVRSPHIPYYSATPINETTAKAAYRQSLTIANNAFRTDIAVMAEEQGWYGEYQTLTKNPAPREEPGWQTAMRHFYEILNEAGMSWSHFSAFAYQSYGLWEEQDTVWATTQKYTVLSQVGAGQYPSSWTQVLSSSFEADALGPRVYTDPPLIGFSENDVGPGTLEIVNTVARTGTKSMHSIGTPATLTSAAYALEMHTVMPQLNAYRVRFYFMFPTDASRGGGILYFNDNAFYNNMYLRVFVVSGSTLQISSRLTGFPETNILNVVTSGVWHEVDAWIKLSGSLGSVVFEEGVVNFDGQEVFRKSRSELPVVPTTWPLASGFEVGLINYSTSATYEVYVDDVVIWH